MTRYLFVADVGFDEEATAQLHQPDLAAALKAVSEAIPAEPLMEEKHSGTCQEGGKRSSHQKRLLDEISAGSADRCPERGQTLVQSWLILNQRGTGSAAIAAGNRPRTNLLNVLSPDLELL